MMNMVWVEPRGPVGVRHTNSDVTELVGRMMDKMSATMDTMTKINAVYCWHGCEMNPACVVWC